MDASTLIILIAPNVSQVMGGEGIKALQTYQHLKRQHPNTLQITHERNREHIEQHLKLEDVYYLRDDVLMKLVWKTKFLQLFLDYLFSRRAIILAEQIAAARRVGDKPVIIHQTGPNSPVKPRAISGKYYNSFGPVNGNIHYPEPFKYRESFAAKLKRVLHHPLQKVNALLFNQMQKAELIFVAGGGRTEDSLLVAGCDTQNMVDTVDCGVEDYYLNRPRIRHRGQNLKLVHFGRLVDFKGTDLAIKALAKTSLPITLDIIGSGPKLKHCKSLVSKLGLEGRVKFFPWRAHDQLLDSLSGYRALVMPSLADSNGIVVQEVLAMGLPPICLDWGGPQLLVAHQVDGYLVPIDAEDVVTANLASCMDDLANNGQKAEQFSITGRASTRVYQWSKVAEEWLNHLDMIGRSQANSPAAGLEALEFEDYAA